MLWQAAGDHLLWCRQPNARLCLLWCCTTRQHHASQCLVACRCWRVVSPAHNGRPATGLAVSRGLGDLQFKEPVRCDCPACGMRRPLAACSNAVLLCKVGGPSKLDFREHHCHKGQGVMRLRAQGSMAPSLLSGLSGPHNRTGCLSAFLSMCKVGAIASMPQPSSVQLCSSIAP